jgi:hypothetical protein
VRVLLDECVDWRLGRELASHEVKTARQMGGRRPRMGTCSASRRRTSTYLSPSIETCPFNKTLSHSPIAVLVLQARTNRLADLRPLVPRLLSAIEARQPGTAKFISQS